MSYDFALQKLCSHEIRMERGAYNSSSNTIRFRTPPTNQRVVLHVDGVEVPTSGLYSHASVSFMNPGPYRIKKDQNDLIYVKMGNDTPVFVQLITGNVKTQDMVLDLSRKLPNLEFSTNLDRVLIKSKTPVNGASFTFVDPRWTDRAESLPTTARVLAAYAKLGIVPGRVVSGKRLFPAWTIEKDELSSFDLDKALKFHGPIPNQFPVMHVSYVTYPSYCRRCAGTRIEFDYSIMGDKYETVDGADLLSQEFDKFLFTRLGSHWRWTWLGSRLIDRIGGKGTTANTTVNAMLSMDVSQAFAVYQNIKMHQSQEASTQEVSDAEYPLAIRSLGVSTMPDDPTVAIVNITIACRSLQPVTLKRIVGNPNPYSIGSNVGVATNPSFLLRG